ncbi:TPA: helix-turn-helix transcriptional regulator [Streptococcus suis]
MANIITNLKELRKAQKITQQELAEMIGVRRESIVHLENNRYNPSLEMALKIAEIFNCPVEEIFQLNKEA